MASDDERGCHQKMEIDEIGSKCEVTKEKAYSLSKYYSGKWIQVNMNQVTTS